MAPAVGEAYDDDTGPFSCSNKRLGLGIDEHRLCCDAESPLHRNRGVRKQPTRVLTGRPRCGPYELQPAVAAPRQPGAELNRSPVVGRTGERNKDVPWPWRIPDHNSNVAGSMLQQCQHARVLQKSIWCVDEQKIDVLFDCDPAEIDPRRQRQEHGCPSLEPVRVQGRLPGSEQTPGRTELFCRGDRGDNDELAFWLPNEWRCELDECLE